MLRSLFALSALALTAAPAAASSYSAKLAAPTSERFVTRDITWNCGPAACQGSTQESRPLSFASPSPSAPARSTASSSTAVR